MGQKMVAIIRQLYCAKDDATKIIFNDICNHNKIHIIKKLQYVYGGISLLITVLRYLYVVDLDIFWLRKENILKPHCVVLP